MSKIFESGMGVDAPASMQMCKSVPKLHSNSVQKTMNLKRDNSLRHGTL